MEFIEMDKDYFKSIFNFNVDDTSIYALKDKSIVGYGFVKWSGNNPLNVYVIEQCRGNGYGTMIFKKLLRVIDNKKEISFRVLKENVPINRIIKSNGGILIAEDGNYLNYIVPLINNKN